MRIDSHVHVWPAHRLAGYDWITDELKAIDRPFSIDELRPTLTAVGVDGVILVQTEHTEEETREFLHIAATDPQVVAVVGWVDLTADDVEDRLAAMQQGPGGARLVGVRHLTHDEPDAAWLDREDVRSGLAVLERRGLVFDLLVRTRELPAARRCVQALPGLRFVLDHAAKPPLATGDLEVWEAELRAIAAAPNLVCKLSGLVTEAAWDAWPSAPWDQVGRVLMEAFGPSRLLFGSDWPVATLAATYGEVLDLALRLTPEESIGPVLGGSAMAWYGVPQ